MYYYDKYYDAIYLHGFTEGLFEAHVHKAYQALKRKDLDHEYAVYLKSTESSKKALSGKRNTDSSRRLMRNDAAAYTVIAAAMREFLPHFFCCSEPDTQAAAHLLYSGLSFFLLQLCFK